MRLGALALCLSAWTAVGLGDAMAAVPPLRVASASPQGTVTQVRQFVARFDADAVRFGDPLAAAPLEVRCTDAAAPAGAGRWTNAREWVYTFESDVPAGVRCSATAVPGFRSPADAALAAATRFDFDTGGPAIRRVRPNTWQDIEEEQTFVLEFSAAATAASVAQHVWCKPGDLGEQVPVRAVESGERAALLETLGLSRQAQRAPARFHVLACQRRLTAGTDMQLVVGTGIRTPGGLASRTAVPYDYTVRAPFSAHVSCERENAQADCLPIRPLNLQFSAPVKRSVASAIRLVDPRQPGAAIAPQFDEPEATDGDAVVQSLRFASPLPVRARLQLEVPAGFQDASGRPLADASAFPLSVATGDLPPLAKFAASPFGVIERHAEPDGPPLLPVTLRRVEAALPVSTQAISGPVSSGQVRTLRPAQDADIIRWWHRIRRYDEGTIDRKVLRQDGVDAPPPTGDSDRTWVATRQVSLLDGQETARKLALPAPLQQDPRPFEVVGIPMEPGFSVVEIASSRLGEALLDPKLGADRTLYVRTSVLVTNLGLHFKLGRENALAWVTRLDNGQPVADAAVRVSTCDGREVANARTDAQGIARLEGLSPRAPTCSLPGDSMQAYFVSARTGEGADSDMAFVWSDWTRGIESWRFNVPTDSSPRPDTRLHTVLDRSLLRAGETVSMKHLVRQQTAQGLAYGRMQLTEAKLVHVGSGQEYPLVLQPGSGQGATSTFAIPRQAKLGVYEVSLTALPGGSSSARNDAVTETTATFRVEEFRLPVMTGRIQPAGPLPLVQPGKVEARVQIDYLSGGPARQLPVRVSALLRPRGVDFPDHAGYRFDPPRDRAAEEAQETDGGEDGTSDASAADTRIVLDQAPLALDNQGQGHVDVGPLPPATHARELVLEASYSDPNGEIQTLSSTHAVWPSGVVAGIRAEGWASAGQSVPVQALALDTLGRPQAGVALSVRAIAHTTTTSRKRMVGGFYSYDHERQTQDLGEICQGRSDSRGLLACTARLAKAGEIELVVTATDAEGRISQAAESVWIARQGEMWFDAQDHDRIDLLPEKKSYQAGDTAVFQVRMPFRRATALVTVEREGILHHEVMALTGEDPTVRLKVQPDWGPNVYVSALVLRGRLVEVPWYSFFTWGYKAPREWWRAFRYDSKEYTVPTALVDLSKPTFRIGVAEIRVGLEARQLQVQVQTDQSRYAVRGQAQVTVTVRHADGSPAPQARIALAAVDQALLDLWPNTSWQLLEAMYPRRSWGVQTATAQMELIGRRHYGRKAVPAGGDGGGNGATRELFDTLLTWQPDIALDAQGQARLTVPLNDALTQFRIVAIAEIPQAAGRTDAQASEFGTGSTQIQTTQDLQLLSGLPPLVRSDDRYVAQVTVRNTTAKAMAVELVPSAPGLNLPKRQLDVPAGEAREAQWDIQVPADLARATEIPWQIEARDTSGSGAQDRIRITQRLLPAVPLGVQQATLVQLPPGTPDTVDATALPAYTQAVALPAGALPGRGGLKITLQPRLAQGLSGVRDWFENYPYTCLEQQASRAIGLGDAALWSRVVETMPTYLDEDGLANYFPPRSGDAARGSDTLTAYLLAASDQAATTDPAFALPPELRTRMQNGLLRFVEGRLERRFWSPRPDLEVRKLAALEALSRGGQVTARLLGSLSADPNRWPTSAVVDWLSILRRVTDAPLRERHLQEAGQVLRSRLSVQGTRLVFSTESTDEWWWLMAGGDTNAARLLLAVMDDPAWREDLPRLVTGLIGRQQRNGAWRTTTANLWGSLALQDFGRRFESVPVDGTTQARLGAAQARVDWRQVQPVPAGSAPRPDALFGAPVVAGQLANNAVTLPWPAQPAELQVKHEGSGSPWMTLQSIAAVPRTAAVSAGYSLRKSVTAVEQAQPGRYSRGDVLRIALEIDATADMSWVVVQDPVPTGATVLGSGLGRDSAIAAQRPGSEPSPADTEETAGRSWNQPWLAFEERGFESWRAYYAFVPKGRFVVSYTVRLNSVGEFALPASRVEALYAPEMFAETPNARLRVVAAP